MLANIRYMIDTLFPGCM